MNAKGEVRGYYSDLLLDPELPDTHALYPSIEHITFPKQHGEIVVETRVVNDMKCILSEEEFWHAIEHLSFCRRRSEEDSLSDCSERRLGTRETLRKKWLTKRSRQRRLTPLLRS